MSLMPYCHRSTLRQLFWLVTVAVWLFVAVPHAFDRPAWAQEEIQEGEKRLRRVYVPFSELSDWMRQRQTPMQPMSFGRYSDIVRFLNRSDQQPVAEPLLHYLRLQRSGLAEGYSLFKVPQLSDDQMALDNGTVDFGAWNLPGRFYRAEYEVPAVGSIPTGSSPGFGLLESMKLTELDSGIDQDGVFGVPYESSLDLVVVRYSVSMSTGELFEGRKAIQLPVSPTTETRVTVPAGMPINSPQAVSRLLHNVPRSPADQLSDSYRMTTTDDHLRLAFDVAMPRLAKSADRLAYRSTSRHLLNVDRQSFETTLNIEPGAEGPRAIRVMIPAELQANSFQVSGRNVTPELESDLLGNQIWSVRRTKDEDTAELVVGGDWLLEAGVMTPIPECRLLEAEWLEGTVTVAARRPLTIQDFQLIDSRFQQAQQSTERTSISARYLSPDSQIKIAVDGKPQAIMRNSYARVSFQEEEVQSQQWMDIDLGQTNRTSLQMLLDKEWIIGQIGVTVPGTGDSESPADFQSLVWYRDSKDAERLTVHVPEQFMGVTVRLFFEGRRGTRLGKTPFYEGLRLESTPSKSERLVAVTSTSPVAATVQQSSEVKLLDAETARQKVANLATFQPEPTYLIDNGTPLTISLTSQEISKINVVGVLKNTLLGQQMLQQEFHCEVQLFGASLQQFQIFTNQWGPQLGAWEVADSEGNPVEFTTQITANEQGSLTTFKLRQAISTSLRMKQTRNVTLEKQGVLPAYRFPDAGSYLIQVLDRTQTPWTMWYEDSGTVLTDWTTEVQETIRLLYGDQGLVPGYRASQCYQETQAAFPRYRLLPMEQRQKDGVLVSENYWHYADSEQVRTVCKLHYLSMAGEPLVATLPDGARLDAVAIDGVRMPTVAKGDRVSIQGEVGEVQEIELRYSTGNKVELFQLTEKDFRLELPQMALNQSQRLRLADPMQVAPATSRQPWFTVLAGRWLLSEIPMDEWQYSGTDQAWVPLRPAEGFRLIHGHNQMAWRWLLGVAGFVVGVILFGMVRQLLGVRLSLNSILLLLLGLAVVTSPFPVGQLIAAGVWGLLAGHCLAHVKKRLQIDRKLPSSGLASTVSRMSLVVVGVLLLLAQPGVCQARQELVQSENDAPALVVIPVDKDEQPTSVVYLDEETFELLGNLERQMGSQTRLRVHSSRYELDFEESEGFRRFVWELVYSSATDGEFEVQVPIADLGPVDEVTIDGVTTGSRQSDDKLIVSVAAGTELTLRIVADLEPADFDTQVQLQCLPTAATELLVRGIPTSWMVELLDLKRNQLIDRSYSQRTFEIDRLSEIAVRVAADQNQLSRPIQETWLNIGPSKVGCKTLLNLGPYHRENQKLRLLAEKRLVLPARYYYAAPGFEIKEIGVQNWANVYELKPVDNKPMPEWIEIEWETDFSSLGRLIPPRIELEEPSVAMEYFVGLTIDRRLLFQVSDLGGFERIGTGRLPSLRRNETSTIPNVVDQAFRMRSTSFRDNRLGEIRYQPVQATGELELDYLIESEQVELEVEGRIELSLGELPQLRLRVPMGFRPQQVFVGNGAVNEVAWSRVVDVGGAYDLICFLKQPKSGSLDLKVVGNFPATNILSPGLLREQLPELQYRINIFHPLESTLAIESTLAQDSREVEDREDFICKAHYALASEDTGAAVIGYELNRGRSGLQVDAYYSLERHRNGSLFLRTVFVLKDENQQYSEVTLPVGDGYGKPELVSVDDLMDSNDDLQASMMMDENGHLKISWDRNVPEVAVRLLMEVAVPTQQLELPELLEPRLSNIRVQANEAMETEFKKPAPGTITLPAELGQQLDLSPEATWFQLSANSGDLSLQRLATGQVQTKPTIRFHQLNYRRLAKRTPQIDCLYQAVIQTGNGEHQLQFQLQPGTRVLQVWNNQQFAVLKSTEGDEATLTLAIDPTRNRNVISMRLTAENEEALEIPKLVGSPAPSVYVPSLEPVRPGDMSYLEARTEELTSLDDDVARGLLIDFLDKNRRKSAVEAITDEVILDRFSRLLPVHSSLSTVWPKATEKGRSAARPSTGWMVGMVSCGILLVVVTCMNLRGTSMEALCGLVSVIALVYGILLTVGGSTSAGTAMLGLALLLTFYFVVRFSRRSRRWYQLLGRSDATLSASDITEVRQV